MHKNRTTKGIALEKKHDCRYKKMLIGKKTDDGLTIIDVSYVGNSVYGLVELRFDNGTTSLCSSRNSFRPTKQDLVNRYGVIL